MLYSEREVGGEVDLPRHWMRDFFLASLCLEVQENQEALSRLQVSLQLDLGGHVMWLMQGQQLLYGSESFLHGCFWMLLETLVGVKMVCSSVEAVNSQNCYAFFA